MVDVEHSLYPITLSSRRILGTHPNITLLVDGIEQDQSELDELFASFDTAVRDYNAIEVNSLPSDLNFLPKIKPVLETIPTIRKMIDNPHLRVSRSFIRTLHIMDSLMKRAEDQQPEPNIGFHIWEEVSDRQRIVGAVFQAYGLTIANMTMGRMEPRETLFTRRDTLLDGLIEIMALNRSTHLHDPVFDVVKSLGWFNAKNESGDYLFTQSVRNLAI